MNSETPANLYRHRLEAAEISRGISSNVIYDAVIKAASDVFRRNGTLLDFGAGVGHFVRKLLRIEYSGEIVCADLIARPDDFPLIARWCQADLNEPLELPSNSFDVITAIEIIEHLENPRAVFREFYRLLRSNGTLIVSTPNQESLRSLISLIARGHFIAFTESCYPAHITALVRKDLERIAKESCFIAPHFVYTDFGHVPKMTRFTWQGISRGLAKGRRFSDNIIMVVKKGSV